MTLEWATYRDASDQCSLSRIWGGIHPPTEDVPGLKFAASNLQAHSRTTFFSLAVKRFAPVGTIRTLEYKYTCNLGYHLLFFLATKTCYLLMLATNCTEPCFL